MTRDVLASPRRRCLISLRLERNVRRAWRGNGQLDSCILYDLYQPSTTPAASLCFHDPGRHGLSSNLQRAKTWANTPVHAFRPVLRRPPVPSGSAARSISADVYRPSWVSFAQAARPAQLCRCLHTGPARHSDLCARHVLSVAISLASPSQKSCGGGGGHHDVNEGFLLHAACR